MYIKRVGAKLPNGHPPSQNLTADFYANRAQLLILSLVLHHPKRTVWLVRSPLSSAAVEMGKKKCMDIMARSDGGFPPQLRSVVAMHTTRRISPRS